MKPPRPPFASCFLPLLLLLLAPGARADSATASHTVVGVAAGVTGLTATASRASEPTIEDRARDWMRSLTPGWMPNHGQVAGPDGRAADAVLYSLRMPTAQLHVTPRGLTAIFTEAEEREGRTHSTVRKPHAPREVAWSALEVELVGATIRPGQARAEGRIEALGEQHFYAPHCPEGVLGVPSFERVTFRDVYPGIDWVLVADRDGPVQQDFIVHPGADPNRIRLRYRGARDLRLDAGGRTLHMRTALGEVSEGPLRCYQDAGSRTVPARFRLERDVVSVKLDRWDRTAPLTIDPPLLWSTLYGGNSYDGPKAIYCDNRDGDVYVVGYTASTNLPCSTAAAPLAWFSNTAQAPPDAFIWKFSQTGARKWATYYAGNGEDYAVDCTVDRLGNLYVTGNTSSSNFPFKYLPGAYNDTTKASGTDVFVLRFDSQGVRQWATFYGGNSNDFAGAVTTDSLDRVYVVGSGGSTDLFLVNPGGAYFQPALNGPTDNFILRFNTLGSLTWATYHGGESGDAALGVAANATDLYVTGLTWSTVFPTVDPPGNSDYFQGANGGQQDAFISRFTLAGQQTWSTFYGGTDFEEARRPVITPTGDVYVNGLTNSSDLPVWNPNPIATPNQPAYFQGANASAGMFDLFMLRFTAANARTWATYLGGTGPEDLGRGARSLTADAQGRAYLTGVSGSNDFPFVNPGGGAYFQNSTTNSDVIYARFSLSDSLEWATFFGGGGASFGTGVAIGLGGCLFGTGEFQGTGFNTPAVDPPGMGAWFRTSPAGNDDGFVTRFCANNSACCIDLTCIPVASAAECNALGGTAFHLDQTCAQVNCSVLCNVNGRKFSDLNRNGAQEGGEPGLANWTVELRDLANNLVATALTAANGDYSFPNIPCGNYLVTEAAQTGWVMIAPAGPGHSLSLPIATTANNVDFGNYSCPTPPPCTPMPAGLSAYWPFDDGPGATQAMDVTHASAGRNRLVFVSGSTGTGSMCVASPAEYATVAATQQAGLDFGTGSFGISVWVHPDPGTASGRAIVEKRGATLDGGLAGWALQLDGLQCVLSLATGSAPQVVSGPVLPAGSWSHVAVSVDRATGQGRWYLDGVAFAAADFTPITGSLDNTADLFVGQSDPAWTGATGPGLQGCLAQLALFHAPITPEMAAKAYGPGGTGVPVAFCPDYAVLPAAKTICATQNTVQVCFSIGNNSASPATYSWSLAGLPVGPGCTNAGPTQFNPSAGTVTVPAGGLSASICVTITRPNAFTQQAATACFALTIVNHTTGTCRTRTSQLKVDNTCWCATANPAVVQVAAIGGVVPFGIKRPCDPITAIAYRVVPRSPDTGAPDATLVSVEGAKPGTPLLGTVSAGEESEALLPVYVYFPGGFDAAGIHELVLEADTDGDGVFEALASTVVMPAPGADGTTGVPGDAGAPRAGLLGSPNPFIARVSLSFTLPEAGAVALEVFDMSGRIVRSLVRGWLEPGPRRVTWDGRDNGGRRMAPGVYLARLRTRSGTQETRIVKVQ